MAGELNIAAPLASPVGHRVYAHGKTMHLHIETHSISRSDIAWAAKVKPGGSFATINYLHEWTPSELRWLADQIEAHFSNSGPRWRACPSVRVTRGGGAGPENAMV